MEIRVALAGDIAAVQELWREYWALLGLPGDFQGFDEECRSLSGVYRLLIALDDGRAVGTGALRPLSDRSCEAKRLFVRPEGRGKEIGRSLLQRLIKEAQGYDVMFADTLPSMSAALKLYRAIGFVEVGPYAEKPTPGAIYLALKLPPATAPTTR
jgi:putative acetyltransferase